MSSNGQTDTNQDPSSPFQLAQQHFKEKKYLQASLYYEKAIEKDPTNSEIYLLKSQCSYSLSNFEHALREVNSGLEKSETNSHNEDSSLILKVRLLHLRSQIYQEMKDFENAKKDKDRVKRILQANVQNHELSKVLEIEALNESSFKTNDASEHREYFSARVNYKLC